MKKIIKHRNVFILAFMAFACIYEYANGHFQQTKSLFFLLVLSYFSNFLFKAESILKQ